MKKINNFWKDRKKAILIGMLSTSIYGGCTFQCDHPCHSTERDNRNYAHNQDYKEKDDARIERL